MPRLLLLYQFWLTETYIYCKPRSTRDEMCDLQIALPRMLMLPFFYISSTPHVRHICTSFELWGRPFCSSLSFGVTIKGIQFTQLCCHISFLSFLWLTTCFLSSRGWLLDSHKHWLFCLHIQPATHCLFEQRTSVGSSEAAVCGFCLSISLHSGESLLRQFCDLKILIQKRSTPHSSNTIDPLFIF